MIFILEILARDEKPEPVWEMKDRELLDAARRVLAARGSREKFERVLAKVPDVEPKDYDKL